jgi:hypothetical protein
MRGVSKRLFRASAFALLFAVAGSNAAFASSQLGRDDGWLWRLHRLTLTRIIVSTLSDQLGSPPG